VKKEPDNRSLLVNAQFHHDVDHAWRELSALRELMLPNGLKAGTLRKLLGATWIRRGSWNPRCMPSCK